MQQHANPIGVDVRRGGLVESTHHVHAVVATAHAVTAVWGDAQRLTMPRSAIKSIQMLPVLASCGAVLSDDEVALAASSHSAEEQHVAAVTAWLERIGLDEATLECGPSDPMNKAAAEALFLAGQRPSRLHNCCSGKHAGFLTLAKTMADEPGFAVPGYLDPKHGVQQRVRNAQEQMTGVDLSSQAPVVDGCGIPVYRFPLAALAQSMARLVTPSQVPPEYADAAARATAALPSRSYLVAGTGRAEHVITTAASEPLIIKGGAEGVSMGALPERGIGFALKCEDGAARGVDEAVAALLHHLDVLPDPLSPTSPVRNRAGEAVGSLTVTL